MPSEEYREEAIAGSLISAWVDMQTRLTRLVRQAVTACKEPPSAGGLRLRHRAPTGRRGGPTWLPAGACPSALATAWALPLALSHSEASQWVRLPDIPRESVLGLDTWAEPPLRGGSW